MHLAKIRRTYCKEKTFFFSFREVWFRQKISQWRRSEKRGFLNEKWASFNEKQNWGCFFSSFFSYSSKIVVAVVRFVCYGDDDWFSFCEKSFAKKNFCLFSKERPVKSFAKESELLTLFKRHYEEEINCKSIKRHSSVFLFLLKKPCQPKCWSGANYP